MPEENQSIPPSDLSQKPATPWTAPVPPEGTGASEAANETPAPSLNISTYRQSSGGIKKILLFLVLLIVLGSSGYFFLNFILPKIQSGAGKTVVLTYWGLWEPDEVLQGVLADWGKEHPNIKVNYVHQSIKEYRERLQSALAREEGPDIFRFHITWVPMLKSQLETVPSQIMSGQQFEEAFYPVAKDHLRVGTGFLGLPLEFDSLALFYNQDIFQTAGKTPPKTWDELRRVACQLTTRDINGKIQTAGIAIGTTNNVDHWSDILGLMLIQNSADFANLSGSLAEDALSFYSFFRSDKFCEEIVAGGRSVWDETLPSSTLAFATGKVAMYLGFSWDVFEILNINPRLNFRVVTVPQLEGTEKAWASFWVEGVSKKSKHAREAWEFLKYLSSKETLQKLYLAESRIRLFGEPYPRKEMASLLTSDPLVFPFISLADKAETWYLCSRTFDNGINDRVIKYFEDAINDVGSGKTAKDSLLTVSAGVSQILSQYGVSRASVEQ